MISLPLAIATTIIGLLLLTVILDIKLSRTKRAVNYWMDEEREGSRILNIKIKELRKEIKDNKKLKHAYNKLKKYTLKNST